MRRTVVTLLICMLATGARVVEAAPLPACAPPFPEAQAVPLSSCSLDANRNVAIGDGSCGPNVIIDRSFTGANALGKITIHADGKLALPAQFSALELETAGIAVERAAVDGQRAMPGRQRRHESPRHRHVFTGARNCSSPAGCDDGPSKGIEVRAGGTLRLFGAKGVPPSGVSWTHLARPAGPTAYQGAGQSIGAPVEPGGERTLHLAKRRHAPAQTPGSAGDWIVFGDLELQPFRVRIRADRKSVDVGSQRQRRHAAAATAALPLRQRRSRAAPSAANYGAGRGHATTASTSARKSASSAATSCSPRRRPIAGTDPADANLHWGGETGPARASTRWRRRGRDREVRQGQLGSYPIHLHMAGDVAERAPRRQQQHPPQLQQVHRDPFDAQRDVRSNNVCARIIGHIFYQEKRRRSEQRRSSSNLGLGAMSQHFGLDRRCQDRRRAQSRAGGKATTSPRQNGYDGLDIPNTRRPGPTRRTALLHARRQRPGRAALRAKCRARPASLRRAGQRLLDRQPGDRARRQLGRRMPGHGQGLLVRAAGKTGTASHLKFQPVGKFMNNRVHACYDGLFGETDARQHREQLFPKVGGKLRRPESSTHRALRRLHGVAHPQSRRLDAADVVRVRARARSPPTATACRWSAPAASTATRPGVWALLKDSVLVGVSNNNVDRWGPCPRPDQGDGPGCVDSTEGQRAVRERLSERRAGTLPASYLRRPGAHPRPRFVNFLTRHHAAADRGGRGIQEAFIAYPNPAAKRTKATPRWAGSRTTRAPIRPPPSRAG